MDGLHGGCFFGYHFGGVLVHLLLLFSSIHKRGAGLGPAIAFLYSGPAINILAIILTAANSRDRNGCSAHCGSYCFQRCHRHHHVAHLSQKEEQEKREAQMNIPLPPEKRPMWQTAFHFFTLIFILCSPTGRANRRRQYEPLVHVVGIQMVYHQLLCRFAGLFIGVYSQNQLAESLGRRSIDGHFRPACLPLY